MQHHLTGALGMRLPVIYFQQYCHTLTSDLPVSLKSSAMR